MLDEISREIMKIIYGFGIEDISPYSKDVIPPHRSSAGLHAIFSNVPRTTFYRKLDRLEEEGYIRIKEKKRLSRGYEFIHGKKKTIPQRYSKSREIELTEKGRETVSDLLLNEIPREISVLINQKVKKIPFLEAVEYLKNREVEIHTAFVYLLREIDKRKFPIDLRRIRQEIFSKKTKYILKTPTETIDYVGRKDYLDKIRNALKEYTIISVVGLAGIGKSYLVSHLYHQLEDYRKFWWDFSRDSTDLNVILNTVAGFLKIHYNSVTLLRYFNETKTRDWRIIENIIRTTLDQKSIFFFDNYHVLDENEEREIWKLFNALECPLILCSREKISKLYFMECCEVVLDKGFSKDEVREFLTKRNQPLPESQIEKICSLTKGIPYLVDGFSKIYAFNSDFEELTLRVEEGSFDYIHRQITKNLSEWEKSILNWSSVFRRNEGFEAYDYVYKGNEPTRIILNILVNEKKHLLQTPEGTYVIHDILKGYFYKNLGKKSSKYHKKVARYYLLNKNPDNMIEALYHLLRAGEYKKSVDIAIKHSEDIINKGFLHAFLEILEKLDPTIVPKEDWVTILNTIGKIHEILGNWDVSLERYERAFTLSKEIHFENGEAQSRTNLGSIYYKKGEWDTSIEHFQTALTLYERLDSAAETASVLSELGILNYTKSKWDKAIEYLEKSLDILKGVKDENKEAFALNALGVIYFRKGRLERALEFYREALRIYETLEYTGEIAKVSGNVGLVLGSLNRWDEALHYYNRALELSKKFENKDMIAKTLSEMGVLYFYMEEHDKSIEYYTKALKTFEDLGNVEEAAVNMDCLGISYSCKKEWDKAEEYYRKSLKIKEELKDMYGMAITYNNLGKMLGEKGDTKRSVYYMNKSIELKTELKDDKGIADSLKALTDLYVESNKEKALECAKKGVMMYEKAGSLFGMGEMYFRLGEIHKSLNENEKAIQSYKKCIELFEQTKSKIDIANAYYKLGLLYRDLGDNISSKSCLGKSKEQFNELEDNDKVKEIEKVIKEFE